MVLQQGDIVKSLFATETASTPSANSALKQASLSQTKPPDGTPRIREAAFDDYNQIAALHVRNGLTVRPYLDWVANWKGNPAYERLKGYREKLGDAIQH